MRDGSDCLPESVISSQMICCWGKNKKEEEDEEAATAQCSPSGFITQDLGF